MKQVIKKSVTHQGIGGKEFKIDEHVTSTLCANDVMDLGNRNCSNNWACINFVERREDFTRDFKQKLYYVQVEGYGYVIAEDEIETVLEPDDISIDPRDFDSPIGGGGSGAGAGTMAAVIESPKIDPIKDQIEKEIFQSAMTPNDIIKCINDTIPLSAQAKIMQGGGR